MAKVEVARIGRIKGQRMDVRCPEHGHGEGAQSSSPPSSIAADGEGAEDGYACSQPSRPDRSARARGSVAASGLLAASSLGHGGPVQRRIPLHSRSTRASDVEVVETRLGLAFGAASSRSRTLPARPRPRLSPTGARQPVHCRCRRSAAERALLLVRFRTVRSRSWRNQHVRPQGEPFHERPALLRATGAHVGASRRGT